MHRPNPYAGGGYDGSNNSRPPPPPSAGQHDYNSTPGPSGSNPYQYNSHDMTYDPYGQQQQRPPYGAMPSTPRSQPPLPRPPQLPPGSAGFQGNTPIRLGARTSASNSAQGGPPGPVPPPPPSSYNNYGPGPNANAPPMLNRPPIRLDAPPPGDYNPNGQPSAPIRYPPNNSNIRPPQSSYPPQGPPPPPPPQQQQGSPSNHYNPQQYDARRSMSHDPYAGNMRPPPPMPPHNQHPYQDQQYPPYDPYAGGSGSGPGPGPGPYPQQQHNARPPPPPPSSNSDSSFGPDRRNNRRGGQSGNDRGNPYQRPGPNSDSSSSSAARRQAPSSIDRNDPRTAEEKPCRTLFIRNIDNNTPADSVVNHFKAYGEVQRVFELISKRGICFITYYDLRAAEWAKTECHAREFFGRKFDVHYSLPKDADTSKRCDRDQNQGTLFVLLKRYPATWTDDDFQNEFSRFGQVRSIRRYKDQKNARFLEFFDSRACVLAHDTLGGTEYRDPTGQVHSSGEWDVKFAWDAHMVARAGGATSDVNSGHSNNNNKRRGGAGPAPVGGAVDDGWNSRKRARGAGDDHSQSASYDDPSAYRRDGRPPPSNHNTYVGPPPPPPSGGYGPYGSYTAPNGNDPRQPPPANSPPPAQQWGSNPYAATATSSTPSVAPSQSPEQSRREQAQKVQQLLASLGSSSSSSTTDTKPPPWSPDASVQQPTPQPSHNGVANQGAGAGAGAGSSSAQNAQQSIAQMLSLLQQNKQE
ncbi:unnamed protein product [Sympodiomycopsis kandeliae]